MGKIIAVANQKGGVGKTTTAINLSAGLAEKEKKVLLVDLDSQSNATSGVGIERNNVENSTYELISGTASFEETVIHSSFSNLDVLPSSADLTAAEIELLDVEGRESKLKLVLDPEKKNYDFIIIDCPPSLSMLTVNSLTASDSVLIPIQCEYYALEGLSQLLQTISLVQERINPSLKIEGIVFTMYDTRLRLSRQVVQNVKENLNEKMFRTLIPRNVRLAEAPSHGLPIMHYTRFCAGTRAYRNLAKEVIAACGTEVDVLPDVVEGDTGDRLSAEAENPYAIDNIEETSAEMPEKPEEDSRDSAETKTLSPAVSENGDEFESLADPTPDKELTTNEEPKIMEEQTEKKESTEAKDISSLEASEAPEEKDAYAIIMERAEKEINGGEPAEKTK